MAIIKPLPPVSPIQHQVLPTVTPVSHKPVPATLPVVHPVKPAVAPSNILRDQALSVTQEILKNLAILKKAFLRVVLLLGRVREEKLFKALGYDSIEAYAAAQLGLKRTALYTYLRVYDWIRQYHSAWLKPGAKVRIADLNDADDLIWIEKELTRETLPEPNKKALQNLKTKALKGTLRRSEVRAYKAHGNKIADGMRAFLAKLRHLRNYGAQLTGLPEGVISHMDNAIEIMVGATSSNKPQAKRKASKRAMATR